MSILPRTMRETSMRDEITTQELGFYLADFTDTDDESTFVDWLIAVGL
jgi:hypothetical protein